MKAESKAVMVPIYGHISGTLTVSQCNNDQVQTKKMRLERPCQDDLEGYVYKIDCKQC